MLTVSDLATDDIVSLLRCFELKLNVVADGSTIPGSYWGEPEAGIIGTTVHTRGDTPLHSLLHESCHVICMTAARREGLYRDAGGDDLEESAVCYLQVVLADCLPGVGRKRLMRDMDSWGYSFRLGSTGQWFDNDAEDARQFLLKHGLIDKSDAPKFMLRT